MARTWGSRWANTRFAPTEGHIRGAGGVRLLWKRLQIPALDSDHQVSLAQLGIFHQGVHRRHHHQGEQGGDHQAGGDHGGHGAPPEGGFALPGDGHLVEVVGDAGDHGNDAPGGAHRAHDHGPGEQGSNFTWI